MNQNITLWILEENEKRDKALALKALHKRNHDHPAKDKHLCSKCKRGFDEPKLVSACPHCLSPLEEDGKKGCQFWFGYLNQKDKTESVPKECVDCGRVMECMMGQQQSKNAVSEIQKWY